MRNVKRVLYVFQILLTKFDGTRHLILVALFHPYARTITVVSSETKTIDYDKYSFRHIKIKNYQSVKCANMKSFFFVDGRRTLKLSIIEFFYFSSFHSCYFVNNLTFLDNCVYKNNKSICATKTVEVTATRFRITNKRI